MRGIQGDIGPQDLRQAGLGIFGYQKESISYAILTHSFSKCLLNASGTELITPDDGFILLFS